MIRSRVRRLLYIFFLVGAGLTSRGQDDAGYVLARSIAMNNPQTDSGTLPSDLATDGPWLLAGQSGGGDGGAVHFFRKTGNQWAFFQKLTVPESATHPATSRFGYAIEVEGDIAMIGAPLAGPLDGPSRHGLVYACGFNGSAWEVVQVLSPQATFGSDPSNFGRALSLDGDTLVVSAPQSSVNGRAQSGNSEVFKRVGGVWESYGLQFNGGPGTAPGHASFFGDSTSLKAGQALFTARASDTANVSDPGIYAFKDVPSSTPVPTFEDIDLFGLADPIRPEPAFSSVSYTVQRFQRVEMIDDSAAVSGRLAYDTFPSPTLTEASLVPLTRSGDVWTFGTPLLLPGFSAISRIVSSVDGGTVLVTSHTDRRVTILRRAGAWSISGTLPPATGSDDRFGDAAVISGTTVFVLASRDLGNGSRDALIHQYELKPQLTGKGKRNVKTSAKRYTVRGGSKNVRIVEFKSGRGGFKRAKGPAAAWRATTKLKKGRNIVLVRGTGDGGTTPNLRYVIRQLSGK